VYPLISVTIAYFGGQSRSRTGVTGLAIVYVFGIALSFAVLGLIAALSGSLFGAALQKPVVVLGIAMLLVVLALGSFGLYQFQPPAALMRLAGGARGGALGALLMGLTMGIVAAPCVGPVVVGLVVFVGSRQDPLLGILLFFALALGMGAPYVGLAAAAGSLRRLPRSGEWLLWTERLFGCVLLALAAYFVAPLLPQPLRQFALPAVLVLSSVYLGVIERAGGDRRGFTVFKRIVAAALVGVAVWFGRGAEAGSGVVWEPAGALLEDVGDTHGDRPQVLYFSADWCIPCRQMERTTYVAPEIAREAERFRMVKADITYEDEAVSRILAAHGVVGVPTVILFSSKGEERRRMVGYVGPGELLAAMREAD
jgi:thiol:disulfide interchange protein DsbD